MCSLKGLARHDYATAQYHNGIDWVFIWLKGRTPVELNPRYAT